ncbi:hypothetical protein WAX88_01235 [Photobacterium damselae subsp. damselae]|uniref:helix-turn-helix transcriptional regulator n=1 Tax=Photobacterium damselae TaxID=38293 RepID=UPI00311B1078
MTIEKALESTKKITVDDIKYVNQADVERMFGVTRQTIYGMIDKGTFTPQSKFGKFNVWPHHEVVAIHRALLLGLTKEEQKEVISRLISFREQLLN